MPLKTRLLTSGLIAMGCAATFAFGLYLSEPAFAQTHSGGQGHDSGASHDSHDDSDHGSKGNRGAKRRTGQGGSGMRGGRGSLRDIFRELEEESSENSGIIRGKKKQTGKSSSGTPASKSAKGSAPKPSAKVTSEDDDSDRPDWAQTPGKDGKPGRGSAGSNTGRGDVYGDMYTLLLDSSGVPILKQLPDGSWVVQPIDADGKVIPLDEEGHPIDESLVVEVELGRLNVGRAPLDVLAVRYEEVLKVINDPNTTSVTLDPSGRLIFTIDGVEKTIDSPLENLAIYVELMNTGTLTGVTNTSIFTDDLKTLVDGLQTPEDLSSASSFLAASADKIGSITQDTVVYMNLVLEIEGTLDPVDGDGTPVTTTDTKYVDLSTFTYDRETVYKDATADVLVLVDGKWVPTEDVNLYEAVFSNTNDTAATGLDDFAQAADDARAVIEFVHEYAIPETTVAVQ